MGKETGISWTDSTWNPWRGCKKVSQGCKHCYMFREQERYGRNPAEVVRAATATFNVPLKWRDPALVFTCSWSDWFIEAADEWRPEAWDIIRRTPHLTYQILTKRPENIANRLPADWGEGWPNVWLGTSVEDQAAADKRIPALIDIPARVRFLSAEPLLGPLDLTDHLVNWLDMGGRSIDWVIVGGESGPHARKMEEDWARDIVRQCKAANVPVFVKQMGVVWSKAHGLTGKGDDPARWPEDLRLAEMPQLRT